MNNFASNDSNDRGKAYIGISIGSVHFSKEYLDRVIVYCRDKHSKILILLADAPHFYTFMARDRLSYTSAVRKVQKISDEKIRFLNKIIERHNDDGIEVALETMSSVSKHPSYKETLLNFYMLEGIDSEFHSDIVEFYRIHLKGLHRNSSVQSDFFMGSRYVIEEMAVMIYLQEQRGYLTSYSPMDEPFFHRKFYNYEYLNQRFVFRTPLKNVSHINFV